MRYVTHIQNQLSVSWDNPMPKAPLHFIYRRYVILRTYITASVLMTILTALYEPSSIYYQIFTVTHIDHGFLWSLGIICILTSLDLIINDFLPDKYKLMIIYHNRHILYMMLALGMFSISAVITAVNGSTFYLGRLWIDGLMAAIVAILDIFARHKGSSWR